MSDPSLQAHMMDLNANGTVLQVKKTHLFKRSGYFRSDASRLNAREYIVRAAVPPAVFTDFVRFLAGDSIQVSADSIDALRALSREFEFAPLAEACDSFVPPSADHPLFARMIALEESQARLEREIAAQEAQIGALVDANRSLEGEVARLDRALSDQAQLFQSEQLYRRGCEYVFGTNGFDEQGSMLSQGLGLRILQQSADLGHADARMWTGRCLCKGIGCAADQTLGLRFLRLAADAGNSYAEAFYGTYEFCRENGDKREGLDFLRRAADRGNAVGQLNFACVLEQENSREAVRYYRMSAEQGNTEGSLGYGRSLLRGVGVAEDPERGAQWVKKAADRGVAAAQALYGKCLAKGKGTQRDCAQAARYLQRAIEQGSEKARVSYSRLVQEMPSAAS